MDDVIKSLKEIINKLGDENSILVLCRLVVIQDEQIKKLESQIKELKEPTQIKD